MGQRVYLNSLSEKLLPSPQEMKEFDLSTIATGISGLELMERAGREIFARIKDLYPRISERDAKIIVLAGPGNNGGDGIVIARQLRRNRIFVDVVLAATTKYSTELVSQMSAFCGEIGSVKIFPSLAQDIKDVRFNPITREALLSALSSADFVIDALLGTGQNHAPRDSIAELITVLNEAKNTPSFKASIISIDIPSGANGDSGEVYEPSVKADLTVAVEEVKRGMVQYPALNSCGRIEVIKIGINTSGKCEFKLLNKTTAPKFPLRHGNAHKGEVGQIFVIGGSVNMPGAPMLTSLAALRTGSGLVTQVALEGVVGPPRSAELLYLTVPVVDGAISSRAISSIQTKISESDCIVIGPGIGLTASSEAIVLEALDAACLNDIPVVLDADGITILAKHRDRGSALPRLIITPHPGEAARLLGITVEEVQRDRYSAAKKIADLINGVVVLKGASSVIFDGVYGYVNSTGNPWMATAGSGDVLGGIIASLVGQGLGLTNSAALGVYLHGISGDKAHSVSNGPIIAGDMISEIPKAIGELYVAE